MPTVVAGEGKEKVGQGDANRSRDCFRKEDGVQMEHFLFFFCCCCCLFLLSVSFCALLECWMLCL